MADTELRLSLDEEPSRPFMAAASEGIKLGFVVRKKDEDEEMAESSSGEPQEALHHLCLMPPSRSSCKIEIPTVPDQKSEDRDPIVHRNTTALPRDFDMNQAPVDSDQLEEATTATRRSSGDSGGSGEHVAESEVSSPRASEMEKWSTKKKLRLTMEQSALLEQCFKHHNTLDSRQKLVLAEQLNLSPRQVEVWFQNRRARTKLKQTEEECNKLKLYCEVLRAENRRLLKELQASSMHVPPTTLSLCHSCDHRAGDASTFATTATAHSPLAVAAASSGNPQPRSFAALFPDSISFCSFIKQSENMHRQPPSV